MRHGVENHIYPAKKHLMLRFLIAVAVTGFSFFSSAVYAAPSVTCPAGNCTGSAAEIAHCMTTTGTGACSSGGKCTAKCAGGCVGSFFVALGSAESNNSYSIVNPQGCVGQWQFCNKAHALAHCPSMAAFSANTDYCQDLDEISYQEGNWTSVKGTLGPLIGQTKVVEGVTYTITQAGIMGAAQLCGAGGAIKYFKSTYNPTDAGGTSCARYFANFANTVLPPQFMDASTYTKASTDGSCPQTAQQQPGGQGAANPGGSSAASTPSTSSTPSTAASTPASSASSPSSSMSSMMPMMMMMSMMMPMMQQMMKPANGSGGTGSGGSGQQDMLASMSPLLDALKSLLSGAPANQTSSGSGSGAPQSPLLQQLEQLEAQQQQAASSPGTPSSAILSQPEPAPATPGKKHKDYRISCASMSADPSVEGCRSFVPGGQ